MKWCNWMSWIVLTFLLLGSCGAKSDDMVVESLELTPSEYTLDELLDRHVEAMGGAEALGSVENLVKMGTMSTPEFDNAPVTTVIDDGKGYLRHVQRPNGDIYLAWDGSVAWQKAALMDDEGGESPTGVTELDETSRTLYSVLSQVSGPLVEGRTRGYKMGMEGTTSSGEEVITLSIPGLEDRNYFLDGETFLVVKVVEMRPPLDEGGGELRVVTRYARYQDVSGIQVPMFETTAIQELDFSQSITWDTIEANQDLSEFDFSKPES
ncbi:MAG: hypothetical protein SX243_14195 [Acidobacteriota bacterium]|nr:hypothetical protein [Acidobacteriota bacterium]